MFVRNRSGFDVVLARGQLTEEAAVASLNIEMAFAVGAGGALEQVAERERKPTDPPDIRRLPLWRGVSVTAFGHVHGPPRPPYLRMVELSVGERVERVVAHGPRVWRRRGRDVEPSEAAPFDVLPLGWQHAFGGEHELPPGPWPGTELPHPGGRVFYHLNPGGVGFYPSAEYAVDRPLPAIEHPNALMRRWNDRPNPAGFAPCRELPGLRIAPNLVADLTSRSLERVMIGALRGALRQSHHAHGDLIFDDVRAGTPVSVRHLGPRSFTFLQPASPIDVWVRHGRERTQLPAVVRSIHVDADAQVLVTTFGHPLRYRPASPPEWFEVSARGRS
jgi:hypothetical protein